MRPALMRTLLGIVLGGTGFLASMPAAMAGGGEPTVFEATRPGVAASQPSPFDEAGALRAFLGRVQAVEAAGGFQAVPHEATLRPGDRGAAVALLDRRLRQSGELTIVRRDLLLFDAQLAGAVARFQASHGLDADGVVGKRTFASLNETADNLAVRVGVNLARLVGTPDVGIGRRVVVNVPGFTLTAYRDGVPVLVMPVIVGRKDRPTPLLNSSITHLVLNPEWNVPKSILRKDVARGMLDDPAAYLVTHDLQWDAGGGRQPIAAAGIDWQAVAAGSRVLRLVQPPGHNNPLGRVKFQFDNAFDVYLHDTNDRTLFGKSDRALSSGCVRVADPLALARFVAEGSQLPWEGWYQDTSWRTRWMKVPAPVDVTLAYRTIWAEPSGQVHVRADLYGHDAKDAQSLPAAVVAFVE